MVVGEGREKEKEVGLEKPDQGTEMVVQCWEMFQSGVKRRVRQTWTKRERKSEKGIQKMPSLPNL